MRTFNAFEVRADNGFDAHNGRHYVRGRGTGEKHSPASLDSRAHMGRRMGCSILRSREECYVRSHPCRKGVWTSYVYLILNQQAFFCEDTYTHQQILPINWNGSLTKTHELMMYEFGYGVRHGHLYTDIPITYQREHDDLQCRDGSSRAMSSLLAREDFLRLGDCIQCHSLLTRPN